MQPPLHDETWLGLDAGPLPVEAASAWVVRPDCGAVVLFSGTARDHSAGRPGVHRLEYEAYEEQVVVRLRAIADVIRQRWPSVGRIALLHRVGEVAIGESAVVVAVSAVVEWLATNELPRTVAFCCFAAEDAELYRARLQP